MTQPDINVQAPFEAVDEEGGTDRKRLVALGVVAALVLGGAGYTLMGGGDDLDLTTAPPTKRVVKPVAPPAAVKPVVLPPTTSLKLGRDPFRPLYVVPVAAPVAGPAVPATGGTGTTGGVTITPGSPAKPAAPANYALRLSRVDGTGNDLTAKFLIGQAGKIQFARAGSVFGRTAEIRLLSIQKGAKGTGTAVIQIGDGSPFDISTGEPAIYVP